jgi:hypothetical protein
VKKVVVVVFFFGLLGGLALLCVVWAVVSFGRGEYPTCVAVSALSAAFFGLAAAVARILSGRVAARTIFNDEGTLIRPDRVVDGLFQFMSIGTFIASVTYAIFAPQGKIDIALPPGNHQIFLIIAIGGAISGVPSLWRMFKRGGFGYIRLAPSDFELAQGLSSARGEWDDITDISDRRRGKSVPIRATLFVVNKARQTRAVAIDSYTPGGVALRQLVRYYWINPDRRGELIDGRAIERLDEFGTTS